MDADALFSALFALGVVVAAAALGAALWGRTPRFALVVAAALLGGLTAAAWVAFAIDPGERSALAAGGLTACLLAAGAAALLHPALGRARGLDAELDRAEERLHGYVAREAAARGVELEQLLTRARAESLALLADQERRIAEERRTELAARERDVSGALAETLAETRRSLEARLAAWSDDLERAEAALSRQVAQVGERQERQLRETQARIDAKLERLDGATEEQRLAHLRLRDEITRSGQTLKAELAIEHEQHAAERRRELHELADGLGSRERELRARIEREQSEVAQSIQAGFVEIERKALESLERSVRNASKSYADATAQTFAESVKGAREDAARRFSRELDHAGETVSREAATILADRLAQVGNTGAQRLEKRMAEMAGQIERQQEEVVAGLRQRLAAAEAELRRNLQAIAAEGEGERAVLEARLGELTRRIDEAVIQARRRLDALEHQRVER